MSKKMLECVSLEIPVISEEFLDELSERGMKIDSIESLIIKHKISEWGSDLKERISASVKSNELRALEEQTNKETKRIAKSADGSGRVKFKLKGGAVVDPETGLEDDGHVLLEEETKQPFTAVLGLVDVINGANSYYKLQIIEHDSKKK
jgi:hypothetical protein